MADAAPPKTRRSVWTWGVLALVGSFCFCTCLAVALPGHLRFPAKSKQAECRSNLKYLFTAEKAFYGEHDRYSTSLKEIGFEPERGNRFTYFAGMSGQMQHRSPPKLELADGDDAIGTDVFKY